MRTILLIIFTVLLISCKGKEPVKVLVSTPFHSDATFIKVIDSLQLENVSLRDSIYNLNREYEEDFDLNQILCDSIVSLNKQIEVLKNKPLMKKENFIKLYKYENLLKFYKICKNNPAQWKYYKGWSIREFEK